jgi:nitrogen regulatory protein PII
MIKSDNNLVKELVLITVIIEHGKGSRVLRIARENGLSGGTVLMADGTISNGLLNFLGISDIRKEMILMAAERRAADTALNQLNNELHFEKPHHGIAFVTSLCRVSGASSLNCILDDDFNGEGENMYQVINVIVDKGRAEDVIDAATAAGSRGGTIINARGAGIHETKKVFSMEIEPEKEIIMILSKSETTDGIIKSIAEKLDIEKPGNGIIFVQKALKTFGLYE